MIDTTLDRIETTVRDDRHILEKDRSELLRLVKSLKSEMAKETTNPDELKLSIDGLAASVKGFEASHPALVQDVNYICTVLANMGI